MHVPPEWANCDDRGASVVVMRLSAVFLSLCQHLRGFFARAHACCSPAGPCFGPFPVLSRCDGPARQEIFVSTRTGLPSLWACRPNGRPQEVACHAKLTSKGFFLSFSFSVSPFRLAECIVIFIIWTSVLRTVCLCLKELLSVKRCARCFTHVA